MKRNINNLEKFRGKRVCSRCGHVNDKQARKCISCKSTRFAPAWVLLKRPINRQVGVEITESNPQYGEQKARVTLSKWWPGGYTSFHIPNSLQWEKIELIINNELGPLLGWKQTSGFLKSLKARQKLVAGSDVQFKQMLTDEPEFVKQLVSIINPKAFSEIEFKSVVKVLGEISDVLTNANAGFREAFLSVVKKLPRQRKRALEDLDLLLGGWSLHTITNVAQQVKARLDTIKLFQRQIDEPRTFEIKGDNSIHRILERAMWLVDERYWLLHSNETLRKQIGNRMSKMDRKLYGKKRPDFVCGMVGDKLIILEIKRPSHTLTVDDLNQIETYVTVAEEYSQFRNYEAYLVGTRKSADLARRIKHRSSSFEILTYADLIDHTKQRYEAFLKTISNGGVHG